MARFSHLRSLRLVAPLLLVLGASLAGSALAVTTDEVVARWGAQSVPTSGRFVELRSIPGFPKPLRSEGRYDAVPGERILWAIEKPFPATVEVRPDRVSVTTRSGTSEKRLPSTEAAGFFFALVSGDVAGLSERFDLEAEEKEGRITLTARPKSDVLREFIRELRLSGDDVPDTCVIVNPRGETSEITLSPSASAKKESLP